MEQFTDLSFEYVMSVCKIYVLLESKWRHCSVTTETVNCDISSLENDREMVDHSLYKKNEGASYDYDYKAILTFWGFS